MDRLPFFADLPAHRYTVALDGVQYEVRLVYRDRTASWYLDLRQQDGTAIVLGRRLSPGWSPVSGVTTDGPPGILYVFGADPYAEAEIELWYVPQAELIPGDGTGFPVQLGQLPIEPEVVFL